MNFIPVDMAKDPRLAHFRYFAAMPSPVFRITVKVDVTGLVDFCHERHCSFYTAMIHVTCLAANRIPAFRRRIQDGTVIEYASCGTSHVELLPDDTYCYCTLWHHMNWSAYLPYAAEQRQQCRKNPSLQESDDVHALYFITCMPWVHYEQIETPVDPAFADIPQFCWGRYEKDDRGRLMLPMTLQVNHALMDGVHMGAFFSALRQELDQLQQHDAL